MHVEEGNKGGCFNGRGSKVAFGDEECAVLPLKEVNHMEALQWAREKSSPWDEWGVQGSCVLACVLEEVKECVMCVCMCVCVCVCVCVCLCVGIDTY
jgi:hypothetical protein